MWLNVQSECIRQLVSDTVPLALTTAQTVAVLEYASNVQMLKSQTVYVAPLTNSTIRHQINAKDVIQPAKYAMTRQSVAAPYVIVLEATKDNLSSGCARAGREA